LKTNHSKMHVTEHNLHKGRTIASIYFFMQGLASLSPVNTIYSTLDFFIDRFPTANPSFTFPLANFTSNLLLIFGMVYIKKTFPLNCRVPVSLLVMTLLLLGMPIISLMLPHSQTGLWILYIFLFLSGGFNTIANATVVGLAGHFPSYHIAENATGSSISGLLSNVIRAILLIFFPYGSSETNSAYEALIYYSIAAVVLMFCIYLHYKFIYSDYAAINLPPENLPASRRPDIMSDSKVYVVLDEHHHTVAVSRTAWENAVDNFQEMWRVLRHMKLLLALMMLSNTITAMMFPGVVLKKDIPFLNPAWKIVALVGTFNLFVSLGKFTTFLRWVVSETLVKFLIFIRILSLFIIITQASTLDVPLLDDHWLMFLNLAFYAYTDGFITSSVFILCPSKVTGHDKEIAGFLSLQGVLLGFTIGTYCALPFRNITPS